MLNKKMLLATAILACSMSSVAMAEDLEIHGYVKTGVTLDSNLSSGGGDFEKGKYFLGTDGSNPANQFELVGTKRFSSDNGAQGRLDFRLEYGNGGDAKNYLMSSSGGETAGTKSYFELKETYVTLEKLDFLPEGSSVWAGRKFYGRDSTVNSGEFWKQSSGVGFGYETNKFAVALVGSDVDDWGTIKTSFPEGERQTALVLDTRIKNIKVPGGSVEAQVNLYTSKNAQKESGNENAAETGLGAGLTYNINKWYGIKDGWSKAAITMGTGLGGANAGGGLNFGSWTPGASNHKDAKALFATTYGLVNLSDKLQMTTEFSYLQGSKMFGESEGTITRTGASISPSYKVSKNLRLTADASIGMQKLPESTRNNWSKAGHDETEIRTALTLAPVITINNDFYGRPQIKPFVTFGNTSDDKVDLYDGEQSGTFFGVVAEVWF